MGDDLRSILCGESWTWDSDDVCHISFDKNGTGELIARAELCVWIAAEIEWKCPNPEVLENVVGGDVTSPSLFWSRAGSARLIAQFDIEVTLTRRRVTTLGPALNSYRRMNDELLVDAAFAPKTYTARLEQGIFRSPSNLKFHSDMPQWSPRYNFRIVFDKSPYPPEHEWKDASGGPVAIKFWEWKEFCSGKLPANESTGSIWGCLSS